MDILNGFLDGTGDNTKDIIPVILILILVLGAGKNTGFNLFNTGDDKGSRNHHKHKVKACSSAGG